MNRHYLTVLLFLLPIGCFAQILTQTIRGKITDADTGQPLPGATVQIVENSISTVADTLGNYRLSQVPVGRYRLNVRYLGYQPLTLAEVLVESGREVIQNIELQEQSAPLGEVLVRASRRPSHPVSVKTLTIEEVLRFPATFYDPVRLTTALPGVAGDNDQANGISIRGNSPNGLLWRLEGVDIVNPNHTPNAGTFTDRVTANGGGVNILSAQMLDASAFYTGAFPTQYGNALAGVLDMRLRPGNDRQRQTTLQLGLIGMDFAHEGPFSRLGGASYLFNARYSTVGLLGQLGINFGDEQIRFYDLAFHLNFPLKRGARLTLFGMGGNSANLFAAQRDSSLWQFQKDRFDINFESAMRAIGGTFTQPVGKKTFWRTALAFSTLDSERAGARLDANYQSQPVESDILQQNRLSLHSTLHFKQNARSNWQLGVVATHQRLRITSVENQQLIADGSNSGVLLQPYASCRYQLGRNWTANVGLHISHFTFNATTAAEPRAAISWQYSEKQSLSLAYGLHSQLQPAQLYFATGAGNEKLGFTRAHHVVLSHQTRLAPSGTLGVELYYQHLFNVPVSIAPGAFSALNLVENFVNVPLRNAGTGRNYGVEVSYQRFVVNDFYLLGNLALYESRYVGSDGIERNTRWNGSYILNATAGKEWRRERKNGKISAVWGANTRLAYLGGFRTTPIDAAASLDAGRTVYAADEIFEQRQPAYFRTDVRIYYKRNLAQRSSTLALDIQNATNTQNVAFSYYDVQRQAVVVKNQLGIIPILTWRREF